MIALAPRSEYRMTYEEAILYCQFLEYDGHRDWRIATSEEYSTQLTTGWYLNDPVQQTNYSYYVIPVRDIA